MDQSTQLNGYLAVINFQSMHKSKWSSLIIVSLCISIIGCLASLCFAQTTDSKMAAAEKENLFALIDKLEKSLPFSGTTIAKLTGRTFIPNPDHPSDKDATYCCTKENNSASISQILIREPIKVKDSDRGSVILLLNPNISRITLPNIIEKFGKDPYAIQELPVNQLCREHSLQSYKQL